MAIESLTRGVFRPPRSARTAQGHPAAADPARAPDLPEVGDEAGEHQRDGCAERHHVVPQTLDGDRCPRRDRGRAVAPARGPRTGPVPPRGRGATTTRAYRPRRRRQPAASRGPPSHSTLITPRSRSARSPLRRSTDGASSFSYVRDFRDALHFGRTARAAPRPDYGRPFPRIRGYLKTRRLHGQRSRPSHTTPRTVRHRARSCGGRTVNCGSSAPHGARPDQHHS